MPKMVPEQIHHICIKQILKNLNYLLPLIIDLGVECGVMIILSTKLLLKYPLKYGCEYWASILNNGHRYSIKANYLPNTDIGWPHKARENLNWDEMHQFSHQSTLSQILLKPLEVREKPHLKYRVIHSYVHSGMGRVWIIHLVPNDFPLPIDNTNT